MRVKLKTRVTNDEGKAEPASFRGSSLFPHFHSQSCNPFSHNSLNSFYNSVWSAHLPCASFPPLLLFIHGPLFLDCYRVLSYHRAFALNFPTPELLFILLILVGFFFFPLFETGYQYAVQAGLELSTWPRTVSKSQWSSCFSLPSAGITGICHHTSSSFFFTLRILTQTSHSTRGVKLCHVVILISFIDLSFSDRLSLNP